MKASRAGGRWSVRKGSSVHPLLRDAGRFTWAEKYAASHVAVNSLQSEVDVWPWSEGLSPKRMEEHTHAHTHCTSKIDSVSSIDAQSPTLIPFGLPSLHPFHACRLATQARGQGTTGTQGQATWSVQATDSLRTHATCPVYPVYLLFGHVPSTLLFRFRCSFGTFWVLRVPGQT